MTLTVPPVSAVADVLALWGRDGWLTPPLHPMVAAVAPRVARARTIRISAGDAGPGMAPLFDLLSGGLDGQVLVIAGALDVDAAVWGEILTAAAWHQGAAGVLLHGAVRDRPEMQHLGLPVYATLERVVGPNGYAHVVGVDEPVDIDGTTVCPDDTIVLDPTGCARIAGADADDVLRAAAQYAAGEQRVVHAIAEGAALTSAYLHKKSIVEQLRR